MGTKQSDAQGKRGCVLTVMVLWNAIILMFDIMIGWQLYHQYDAGKRFLPVDAVVLGSYIDRSQNDDSVTYKPRIEYEYEVDGQEYQGDRYSFVLFGQGDRSFADSVVGRYPAGKAFTAYYDPRDPAESLIDPTDDAFPNLVVLFLVPFHCVGVGVVLFQRRIRSSTHLDDDVQAMGRYIIEHDSSRIVLRDFSYSFATMFLLVLGITSFVSIFGVAFLGGGFGASRIVVGGALLACIAIAIGYSIRYTKRQRGLAHRLVIDQANGTLTRSTQTVALDRVLSIGVLSSTTSKKPNKEAWYNHAVSARLDDESRIDLLAGKGYKEHGDVLRRFFKRELGLTTPKEPEPMKI